MKIFLLIVFFVITDVCNAQAFKDSLMFEMRKDIRGVYKIDTIYCNKDSLKLIYKSQSNNSIYRDEKVYFYKGRVAVPMNTIDPNYKFIDDTTVVDRIEEH